LVLIAALRLGGLYHVVLRYVGIEVMTRLTVAVGGSFVLLAAINELIDATAGPRPVPRGVIFIAAALTFLGLAGLRSIGRLWVVISRGDAKGEHRVLIVGAGDAGSLLLRDIENQPQFGYKVVGFLDDEESKQDMLLRGVRILGPIDDLPEVAAREEVAEILVAIPSVTSERRRDILELCTAAGVPTRIISGIATDAVSTGLSDLRPVNIEDLLGREPNEIDVELISETLTGKVVAVTGAAGSIGSELCRQIMKMRPAKLVLIEMDESRLYELYLELQETAPGVAVMRICDVRDDRRLRTVFGEERPQVVLHAAAYKHVPLMEDEPDEAIRANVGGTMNVLHVCELFGVERFVLISTDKAVQPRNVMGATKAVAELLTVAAARSGMKAVAVRFGNVLGSRGSVIPIFEEQLKRGGPVRVTHPEVTRYFMTIPEAARLVLQAQAMCEGGDIFVLDMGEPVRIVDLAQRMMVLSGVHTHIEYAGLRPGEKLHEILVHGDGVLLDTECPAVTRLNALPRLSADFQDRLLDLVKLARIGGSPDIKSLLCDLAGAELDGADGKPIVCGETRLEAE
ncbi:MAG TPA: polysaccharide biosynthesis protein, partial [Actinobacteria bacterium]|nr:polysaccharide biosynthesis protein [Actinomycetota bacterium]